MSTQPKNRISVGDYVSFTLGTSLVQGEVVDDRGPIGVGKVHLFQVRISNAPSEDFLFEMPEDELEIIERLDS